MGKKGLYKQTKGTVKKEEKKPMFHNVAPAGRPSSDPTGDISAGLFMVAVGGLCHMWSKTQFTKVLFIMMCVVAVYVAGRGVIALIKNNKK